MRQIHLRRVISILLIAWTPALALAQLAPSSPSRNVTVALVQALADTTALARIVLSPGPDVHATILLRERNADPETLASAMVAFFDARRRHGDTPALKVVIDLHGHKRAESLTPNERRLAQSYLSRLRAGELADVDGVGRVRTTEIALAPPAGSAPR